MNYAEPTFLLLFLALWPVYTLSSPRLRYVLLLLSSLFFLAWGGILDTLLFLFIVLISWCAVAIAHRKPTWRTPVITVGIALMALHLFFWKYAGWVSGELQASIPALVPILGSRFSDLPLPIGISFFTLQGIAYLVDFSRGQAQYMTLKEYALFKSFFPQLVAGPIVREHDLLPQIRKLHRALPSQVNAGLLLLCVGFFKKIVIGDRLGPIVDPIFLHPSYYDRVSLILGAVGYTVQIWADFSGYTDMGRGVAKLLGITLPENFKSPYLSANPTDFWKRWHITLSEWIRDYLYIPMIKRYGTSFVSKAIVVLVVMMISGLWHGANWTFLLWGIYHGLLLVVHRTWRQLRPNEPLGKIPHSLRFGMSQAFTLIAVMIGWVIFRAQNLTLLYEFVHHLTVLPGKIATGRGPLVVLLFVTCLCFQYLPSIQFEWRRPLQTKICNLRNFEFGAGFALGLFLVISIFFRPNVLAQSFIYFQF